MTDSRLHLYFEHTLGAKSLSETVYEFLRRLKW
jgi:hypothetical protein